ncbi:MAG: hypothetical protein EOO94_04400, partial [Pedobacter sp.]
MTADWSVLQRQPINAIWLVLLNTAGTILKNFWAPMLYLLFRMQKDGSNNWELVFLIVPVIIAVVGIIQYRNFTFRIAGDQLLVNKGIFKKEVITIPLSNIQGVKIEQTVVHKIINLVVLSIDSPGTEKAEVKIHLTRRVADALNAEIIGHHPLGQIKEEQTEMRKDLEVSTLSTKDLLRLGLSANHLERDFVSFN